MRKLFKLSKTFTVGLCSYALLLPAIASAQGPVQEHSSDAGWVNAAMGILGQAKQALGQSYAQRNNTQRALQMRRQMLAASGQPVITNAKFFGHCRLPAAISKFPENACQRINHPSEVALAQGFLKMSQNYTKMYDEALIDGQNTRNPKAIQCLMDAQKKLSQKMNTTIQNLTAEETKIKNASDLIAAQQQKIADQIRQEAAFINGGAADMDQLFAGTTCDNVVNETLFKGGAGSTGLTGVFQSLTRPQQGQSASLQSLSGRVDNNIAKLKQDITGQKKKMRADINRLGIARWAALGNGRFSRLTKNGKQLSQNFVASIAEEVENFNSENQIQLQYLNSIGISVDLKNKNYIREIKTYNIQSIQKRIISDCVLRTNHTNMGFNATGKGLPLKTIMARLEQKGSRINSSLQSYKVRVKNILSSGKPIEDIIELIKAEDQGANITYVDRDARTGKISDMSLSQSLSRAIFACHQETKFGKTFTDASTGLKSQTRYNQMAKDAERALASFKDQEKNFISNIEKNIDDQLVTCAKKVLAPGDCGDPGQMTSGAPNFCARTAKLCKTEVGSCINHTKAVIDKKVGKMRNLVKKYNARMGKLYTDQNKSLSKVTNKYLGREANFYKAYFTGADFPLPKDLMVQLPIPQATPGLLGPFENNLPMRVLGGMPENNGTIPPFYNHFPAQIGKIKAAYKMLLDDPQKGINAQINAYITTQVNAAKANKAKWLELGNQCSGALMDYQDQIVKDNDKKSKDYNKLVSKVKQFCYKYSGLARSNPAAGCGEGSGGSSPQGLYQEAAKISAHLDRSVGTSINAFNNLCARTQNHSESEGEDVAKISDICDGGDLSENVEYYNGKMLASITPILRDDAEEFLADPEASASELLRANPHFPLLKSLRKLNHAKGRNLQKVLDGMLADQDPKKDQKDNMLAARSALEEYRTAPELSELMEYLPSDKDAIKISDFKNVKNAIAAALEENATIERKTASTETPAEKSKRKEIAKLRAALKDAQESIKKTSGDSEKFKALQAQKDQFSDTSENVCKTIKAEKIMDAIKKCADKKYSASCVDEKMQDAKTDDLTATAARYEKHLIRMGVLDDSEVASEWANIGSRMGPCDAQLAAQRRPGGEFDLSDPFFQEGYNKATKTFDGMGSDFFFKE